MDPRLVKRLRDPSIALAQRYRDFMDKRPDLTSTPTAHRFNGHVTQLKIWIGRLEAVKARWPEILFSFVQAQRHYLELEAFLEYMEIRQPLMNSDEYGNILVPAAQLIGAVTNIVVVVEEFAKAGVPVWLIRPIDQFSEQTRIDCVQDPLPAEALNIEMRPWRGHKGLVWNRATDHPQRHDNLMLFGREFLSYTDFGRSSSVRDTIERPLAVPSLGNDYSAVSPRVTSAYKQTPMGPATKRRSKPVHRKFFAYIWSQQMLIYHLLAPKPRVNLSPPDLLHFKPNPNPVMPIMMEAWSFGLSTVNPTKDSVSPRFVEGDNCFVFPPTSVFAPLQSDGALKPRLLKILHTYITHSDILLLRLSPRNSPTSLHRGSWNLLLGPERSPSHPTTPATLPMANQAGASQAKKPRIVIRRQGMQTILAEWTNEYDTENQLRNESLIWASEQLPKDRWPHERVIERILYEINEINFRWEFRMLDRKMANPKLSYYDHEDHVSQCFPSSSFKNEGGADHMSVNYTTAWRGLSSPDDNERRKYVLALARVLADWYRCPDAIAQSLERKASDIDLLTLERACASYYCRSYFYHFGRAPSVPHRTSLDPAQYIMP